MENDKKTKFEELLSLNLNDKTDKKGKYTYLSWAFAVEEMTKAYPNWDYEIITFNNLPYQYDEKIGYMVWTSITVDDKTKKMWLPVMDFQNKAKKNADMMDINKTIMRCLVKNMAMFGLGLYIYAGEDLPSESDDSNNKTMPKQEEQKPTKQQISFIDFKKKIESATTMEELNMCSGVYYNVILSEDKEEKQQQIELIKEAREIMINELSKK